MKCRHNLREGSGGRLRPQQVQGRALVGGLGGLLSPPTENDFKLKLMSFIHFAFMIIFAIDSMLCDTEFV
jgi:hypothetical protein